MTDEEWWEEFGTCDCEQCAESVEIQNERKRILAKRNKDAITS